MRWHRWGVCRWRHDKRWRSRWHVKRWRWVEHRIRHANALILCTDVIVHEVPISGRGPRCHRRAIAEQRVLEPIVLAFDLPWMSDPIDDIQILRLERLDVVTIVEHEEHRVEAAVAIGVDQTVELTFNHFASDRSSMVASAAMYEKVVIIISHVDDLLDDMWESILSNDDLLSLLILPILLVANRCRRIFRQHFTKVDAIPLNVELLCDIIYKPLLARISSSDNRYVLHHSSVAHTISALAIRRLSL